jgi:hypothetical protein
MTPAIEQLAAVQARICLEQARQERRAQQLRALRRAARKERAAERRLIRAWRRGAELRAQLRSPEY